jgi:hypothetical protein
MPTTQNLGYLYGESDWQVSALANGLIPQRFAASLDETISSCQGEKSTNPAPGPYTIAGNFNT